MSSVNRAPIVRITLKAAAAQNIRAVVYSIYDAQCFIYRGLDVKGDYIKYLPEGATN